MSWLGENVPFFLPLPFLLLRSGSATAVIGRRGDGPFFFFFLSLVGIS